MAISLVQVNTAIDTAQTWIDLTNSMANIFSNYALTANSNATTGSLTTGNGFVIGTYGANTIVAKYIRGGNVGTTTALNLTSNLTFGSACVLKIGNTTVNTTALVLGNTNINTTALVHGNTVINTTALAHGNTVINTIALSSGNVVINTTALAHGNIVINTAALVLGITTVNTTTLKTGNVVINTLALALGNTVINTLALAHGNTVINTTALAHGTVTVNTTTINVGTTTLNSSSYTGSSNNSTYFNTKADTVFGQLNVSSTWTKTQTSQTQALANNTGADFRTGQIWTVDIAGTFIIANPSNAPDSNCYVNFVLSMTAAGSVSFGNLYKGLVPYAQSTWTTGTLKDHLSFYYDGTNYNLVGIAKGCNL